MNKPHPTTAELVNQFTQEPNYSDPNSDDFEALARDEVPVRSLQAGDLDAIVRIDRHVTGRDRGGYYRRKVTEALEESGIRLSLVAEQDDRIVGFIMARVDYGDFGQTATSAVIDTLGVDPEVRGRQVGAALVSQLLANLASLRVETVRTMVYWDNFGLLRFLQRSGFRPAQRLALSRKLG
ncbi:MAG: GNAT family N-acetyltransferase [Gammaproteobacteria bacterium]|nr:GNAT family N-acetyltransferase [Gammaproteobacteria bacterium]